MTKFIIEGGVPLHGTVAASGSKNAALPILAATLLTDEPCEIRNIPDIQDVHTMLALLKILGSEFSFEKNTVHIQTHLQSKKHAKLSRDLTCRMRASVLLLGPLLARFGKAEIPQPGGCVLGRRSFDTHTDGFRQLGAQNFSREKLLKLEIGKPKFGKTVLREMSVTATENLLMYMASVPGISEIHLAAMEPHVQDLCLFLKKMGVKINGVGSPHLKIKGRKKLRGVSHTVRSDYLEVGTLVLAAALTKGEITIQKIVPSDLTAFWNLLKAVGVKFELGKNSVAVFPSKDLKPVKVKTAPFPGFPTDLQAPFAVLLTQCRGESKIHETLFEGRLNYLSELDRMGAKSKIANVHEAFIHGPVRLRGARINSHDIRAGAAMILAALAAKGKSEVANIEYIHRGYEKLDEKLRTLGAKIYRSE